jgi:hypothetical protein
MSFKFNHTEDEIDAALGFPKGSMEELGEKLISLIKKVHKDKLHRTSEIVERNLLDLSYDELVVISALYFEKIIKDAKKNKSNFKEH